jgi:hypothetical protein
MFTQQISTIAFRVYIAGIAASTVNGIVVQNKKIEKKAKDMKNDVNYIDYSMESLCGAIMGVATGMWWPLTVIGQGTLAINKLLSVSKNN